MEAASKISFGGYHHHSIEQGSARSIRAIERSDHASVDHTAKMKKNVSVACHWPCGRKGSMAGLSQIVVAPVTKSRIAQFNSRMEPIMTWFHPWTERLVPTRGPDSP